MANDVKTRITQLSDEITKAKAELADVETSLATLREEKDRLPRRPRNDVTAGSFSPVTDDEQRTTDLIKRIGSAAGNAEHLRRYVLPALEKRRAFFLKASTAEQDAKAARQAHARAMDDASSLGIRCDQAKTNAAQLQAELDATVARAAETEQGAAAAYAQAVAGGDEAAQRSAEEHLKAELDASVAAQTYASQLRCMIAALQAEADKLDNQRTEARARAEAALVDLAGAIEAKYALQWDLAVDQLMHAGARMSAARRLAGLDQRSLFIMGTMGMNIPRMEPDVAFIGPGEIHRMGDDVVLDEAP